MPRVEELKKRTQEASPDKQPGVHSHDKKRRHVSTPTPGSPTLASDMDESEGESYSSSPLTIPPPPNFANLTISTDKRKDKDGDDTMVNSSPLPAPPGSENEEELPPTPAEAYHRYGALPAPEPPFTQTRADPPWIIRRTRKADIDSSATQEPGSPQPHSSAQTPNQPQSFPRPNANPPLAKARQPPMLPRGLTRTPAPVGGFPSIYLSTPPWFNLMPEQKAAFEGYPGHRVWIRDWQATRITDLMATSDKLKELVLRMTGERPKMLTPQPENELITHRRNERQKPPYHFLISGLSNTAHNILISHPIISTPEATAFIIPYNPPLPHFLCTIEGFTLSIRNQEAVHESEDIATDIVRRTMSQNEAFVALLKGKLIGDESSQHNMAPALEIINAIYVKMARGEDTADRTSKSVTKKPLWNVFFSQTPPVTWTNYFVLLQYLREIRFIDMDCGSATLVEEGRRFHCFNCKSADHNPGQCEFEKLEGWYGNKAAKVEETVEFVSTNRPDRPPSTQDRARVDRRNSGWGGGGRPQGHSTYGRERR